MSEAFFNLPNQQVGLYLGEEHINPISDDMWDQSTSGDLYVWFCSLMPLNIQLNLAGYKFKKITFKLSSSQSVIVDPNTMTKEMSSSTPQSEDILIEVSPYINSNSLNLGIPVNHITETTSNTNNKVELKIDNTNYTIKFYLGDNGPFSGRRDNKAATNLDDTYIKRLQTLIEKITFEFVGYLSLRWWQNHSDYSSVTPHDMLYRVPDYIGRVSELEALQNQEISSINNAYPSGLLWILNPNFWHESIRVDSRELFDHAEWIFTQFRKMSADSAYKLFMCQDNIWNLRNLIKNLNAKFTTREREESILEAIEGLQISKNMYLPKNIKLNLRSFTYFEIIMILVNYGLIEIPALGEVEAVEDNSLPYDFVLHKESDSETADINKVEIFMRGYGPVTMELAYPVTNYNSGVTYGAESSFSWEYIPGNPDGETEDEIKNNLILVAAPGVSISGDAPDNLPPDCNVHIYRVQNHEDVPEWFTAIDTTLLEFSKNLYNMPEGADVDIREVPEELRGVIYEDQNPQTIWERMWAHEHSENVPAFVIKHRKNGVTISSPGIDAFGPNGNRYFLNIDIDIDVHAADQRFSYYIEKTSFWDRHGNINLHFQSQQFSTLLFPQFILVIHYTGDVKFKISENNAEILNDRFLTANLPPHYRGHINGLPTSAYEGWTRYLMYEADVPGSVEVYRDNSSTIGNKLDAIAPQGHALKYDNNHFYNKFSTSSITDLTRHGLIWDEYTGKGLTDSVPGTMTLSRVDLGSTNHSLRDEVFAIATIKDIATDGKNYGFVSNVTWGLFFSRMFMEVSAGFFLAGDIIDAVEVMQAYKTRKDKWGEPVSDFQFKLMMAGALLPVVSTGAMKVLSRGAN